MFLLLYLESNILFWCFNARVTPVLIPNTEVKPCSGDGTRKGRVARRQNKVLDFFVPKIIVFCYHIHMALWSTKRRWLYGGTVVAVLGIFFSIVFFSTFYKAPTCSDGVKNGNELGVDCGGSCQFLCTADALTPVILWSKIFNISGDVYSAVAYVENPNISSKNDNASYTFRIFDENNHLITVREGKTTIPKNQKFAIFETGFILKNTKPKSADFAFNSFSQWKKDTQSKPNLSISYEPIIVSSAGSRIDGTISNNSFINVGRVEIDAFILDSNENVVASSQTFLDSLAQKSSQPFVFTWPKTFDNPVISIIYHIL